MKKIIFLEATDWEKEICQKYPDFFKNVDFSSEKLTLENAKKFKDYEIVSTFISSQLSSETLKQLESLKFIATRSTGFDHIDLKECIKRKITVLNVPFYGENTVAEHAFALLLSLSRNIHKSYLRTTKDDFSIEGLTGFDLKGKTLGIIGGGHIGMHMAKMAKGFDMNVIVFDINKNDFLRDVVGFEYATLKDLLKKSDVISIHVPYNKFTHHLIGKEELSLMKKGSY